jgi:hypothetical protein
MPEEMERDLKAKAKKMGLSEERAGAYVYGTMRKTGWTPSTQKKQKHHSPPVHDKFDSSKY